MNIYLLTRTDDIRYDTYDSCVVQAKSEEDARKFVVNQFAPKLWSERPESVDVRILGEALKDGVLEIILSSYRAG